MKIAFAVLAALALGTAVSSARADQYSMMATISPPSSDEITDGPTAAYELGTRFITSVNGQVTAIRYWQPTLETGSHLGNLWTNGGTLLESVAFSNETPGWNQATLTTPVNITAGTIYVVSVNSNVYYPDTDQGLATAKINGPIQTVVGSDGLYSLTPDTFPTNEFDNSNYYRDVVFQTAAVPEPASLGLLTVGGLLMLRRRR